ncbi:voltage-gated potassium channel subunit beta [Phytophthora cinnamomi]|uniref:voltage-gated potassium channel subunit beta n=1 Tax=Phytophthora cinnamomi TaxID=4785 RepID=UPI00355A59E4|nr:voltage-gated potassium channel subunit beta [Phytophthora cinnamomi]
MVKQLEEGKVSRPRRVNVVRSIALAVKGATSKPLVVLVLIGLLVFVETRIYRAPKLSETDENACTPKVLDANNIEYHSGHRYYAGLRDIGALPPPVIREEHSKLCSKINRYKAKYEYCLPISGRKDAPFCTAADRMNLLNVDAKEICYASVLHMLLVEVYEELQAKESTPFLAFGSLLGAVRNGSMIPFTEDVDIGYVGELEAVDKVKIALRRKGYHMFYMGIWRICVAPTHPLAGRLYDPELPISESFAVPYVDLYMMKKLSSGDWDMQELEGSNGRLLPDDKVQPFSEVTINGMPFDTVHDPKYFLREAYGDDYMTPKPREEGGSKQ